MLVELPQSAKLTAPSRREPYIKLYMGKKKPPSPREVASPTGLTEGAWSLAVGGAVNFMFVELPQSAKLTAPSRREPFAELNGGDRKASLREGGGKPNGLDGRSVEPYR